MARTVSSDLYLLISPSFNGVFLISSVFVFRRQRKLSGLAESEQAKPRKMVFPTPESHPNQHQQHQQPQPQSHQQYEPAIKAPPPRTRIGSPAPAKAGLDLPTKNRMDLTIVYC
jgi:hypothetical protein